MSHIYFDIPIEPLPDGQSPVKHLKELGCVTVKITPSVSVMVTTAAEAQELKTRFAAAEFYLTDEPLLAPPVHGDEPVCGVRGPEGRFRCACHPGHPGDHVAWGSEAGNGRPFTWPQPFDEFHEYPLPPAGLDDAGDDITDALVPDVAQPADLDAWKANVQQHVECTVGARPGFRTEPDDVPVRADGGAGMSAEDWRALREWLIRARTSTRHVADTAVNARLQLDQEAKFIAYSRVLDFMDERERQALR